MRFAIGVVLAHSPSMVLRSSATVHFWRSNTKANVNVNKHIAYNNIEIKHYELDYRFMYSQCFSMLWIFLCCIISFQSLVGISCANNKRKNNANLHFTFDLNSNRRRKHTFKHILHPFLWHCWHACLWVYGPIGLVILHTVIFVSLNDSRHFRNSHRFLLITFLCISEKGIYGTWFRIRTSWNIF